MDRKVAAIIVAGGTGERMKSNIPKQFIELDGKPIIIHTLEKFDNNPNIHTIIIVSHKEFVDQLKEIVKKYNIKKVQKIVSGGKTRQESSFKGLKACSLDTEYVLIHDAVRPFINNAIINDIIESAEKTGASTPAIDIADTVMLKKGDFIEYVHDRNHLKRIQTPQGFKYSLIMEAHEKAIEKGITGSTDDCGLVLAMNRPVKIIEGSSLNIKLTEEIDLFVAEKILGLKK